MGPWHQAKRCGTRRGLGCNGHSAHNVQRPTRAGSPTCVTYAATAALLLITVAAAATCVVLTPLADTLARSTALPGSIATRGGGWVGPNPNQTNRTLS